MSGLAVGAGRAALLPVSLLWGAVSRCRNLLYDRGISGIESLPVPVVSVGNITAGGTGKTPLVIHLARRLLEADLRPLVLSRGYGSNGRGTRVVADGERLLLDAARGGDEPVLIASSVPGLPVVVDPDRARGGREAVRLFAPRVILLDDGFQHRRLARDLDIVVLDATDPFGHSRMLPSGLLREPLRGLARADLIIVTRAPEGDPLGTLEFVVRRYNPAAPILRAWHEPEALLPLGPPSGPGDGGAAVRPPGAPIEPRSDAVTGSRESGRGVPRTSLAPLAARDAASLVPVERLDGAAVYAFCGVGNPSGFRATLEAARARLAGFETFPDHHVYAHRELEALSERASAAGASLIVTTEKDAVRIGAAPLALPLFALRIRMRVPDEARLLEPVLAMGRRQ